MNPNDSRTGGGPNDGRDWRGITRRFGYYFVGIAVGFALLGVMRQFRPPRPPPGNLNAQAAPNTPANANDQSASDDARAEPAAGEAND